MQFITPNPTNKIQLQNFWFVAHLPLDYNSEKISTFFLIILYEDCYSLNTLHIGKGNLMIALRLQQLSYFEFIFLLHMLLPFSFILNYLIFLLYCSKRSIIPYFVYNYC